MVLLRITLFCSLFFLPGPVLWAQTAQFGERIREPASNQSPEVKQEPSICKSCGRPTLWGFNTCFHCMQQQAPHEFKQWADNAMNSAKESLQKLRDPKLTEMVIEKLLEAKKHFRNQNAMDPDEEKEAQRQAFESLGKIRIGCEQKELNDITREYVQKYLPALEGTDYVNDPAKTISYFLILDGKGFCENVRIIRGPLGQSMTLLEAYEYYTRTDPKKARDMLQIIDNIRKLSSPDSCQESIPILLDTLGRNLRLLSK